MKPIMAKGLALIVVDVDRDDIDIEIAWIKRDAAVI